LARKCAGREVLIVSAKLAFGEVLADALAGMPGLPAENSLDIELRHDQEFGECIKQLRCTLD